MSEETMKKFVHTITDEYHSQNKPTVDVSLCSVCNKMTANWWLKSHQIVWMCEECQTEESKRTHDNLEHKLERMCDEHNQ